jgi:enamine deaminase RidA (YjgF/YER057c/UK114 family)
VGILSDGSLAQGITDQTHTVWKNIVTLLQAASMDVSNLVRITTFVIHPDMIKPAGEIRKIYLGTCRPASTAISVQALAHPDWLIEIDALAFCCNLEQ